MKRQFYILLFLLIASASQAQEEWSLLRCIDHAIENNLSIKQSEIDVDYAKINETQAKHSRYPNLNLGTSLNSNFGRSTDPITNDVVTVGFISNNLRLSSGVTVFNGFRISNTLKQSAINTRASEYDLEQSRRDISLSVANSYINVLFADENLAIAQSQLSTTEKSLIRTQRLIDAGVRPANEALDILAQIANNELLVIASENTKEIALLNLKQLLRIDPDVSMILTVPSNLDVESDPDILTFNEVYNSAMKSQYNIKAAEMRVESAHLNEKIAGADLLPSVSFNASIGSNYTNKGQRIDEILVERQQSTVFLDGVQTTLGRDVPDFVTSNNPYFNQLDENLSYGFGFSANYPIYSNYTTKLGVERAKLNIIDAQNLSEQTKDRLKTTVQQALADAKASKRKLNASEKSVEAQRASYNNADKKLNAGTINSFEFISIENALHEAEFNAVLSKYEFLFNMKVLDFYMGKPINL